MDGDTADEKKALEAELEQQQDDKLPDPEENLILSLGGGRAWSVKIPKFLMERWSNVSEENQHLATLRVYKERTLLFLPPNLDPADPSSAHAAGAIPPTHPSRPAFAAYTHYAQDGPEPDIYELDRVNDNVPNQIVVAERAYDAALSEVPKPPGTPINPRARTTILTGHLEIETNMRPGFTANYRKQMRKRHEMYNTKTRTIQRIESAGISGGRGGINMLTSGVGVNSGGTFSELVSAKQKPAKGQFERMARIPRNQLLDMLFGHFRDSPLWTLRNLREKTQQPEAYLKEVLSEIASLHRSGEHNGHWELKDNFKEEGIKGEDVAGPSGLQAQGDLIKMDPDADMDDFDDDEDDDMEEVS